MALLAWLFGSSSDGTLENIRKRRRESAISEIKAQPFFNIKKHLTRK